MLRLPPEIILFDLEYTAWEGSQERRWNGENEYREVVQIGATKIETESFEELDSFLQFVKPVKNPILSDYFKDLTGITQAQVDNEGVKFSTALTNFGKWSGDLMLYSFGTDGTVLEENASLLKLPFPFKSDDFSDIKKVFSAYGIDVRRYMSSTITEAFGVMSPYKDHDALADARSIVLGLKLLSGRMK